MSNQEKVQLTIRCAMQSSADYNVECQLDWTVLQLKQHLAHICSFKPEIERQRLIYAGRCLENEQKIHEVLRLHRDGISRSPDEQLEKQVIHMVYIGKENINGTNNGEGGVRHRTNATSIVNPQNTVPNTGPISQPQPAIIPPPMPIFNMNAQQSHEAWLTAYNNYMAQMMQFYQQPAAGMPFRMQLPYNAWAPMQQYGQPFHITNHHQQLVGFPVGQQLPNAQPLMNGHQNAMQNQQQMPLAANMQAGNNEIQVQADFLDLIYKSIRFALLAMIIFLYSSLERFFFVLCVVALFWFVQMRRGRRNPPQPNGDHQQQAEAPREPIIAQNQAAEQGPIGHEERPMPPPPVQAAPASLTISGAWNVFSTVIQSFFTSLIPENQAPLEIN